MSLCIEIKSAPTVLHLLNQLYNLAQCSAIHA
jgi:hypothetical protein